MSELVKRTLSGAIYVAAVVGSILWHPAAFSALFLIFCLMAVNEYHLLVGSSKTARGVSIVAALLLFSCAAWFLVAPKGLAESWGIYLILAVTYALLLFAALIEELWTKAENPIANWGNLLVSQVMIALPFATMAGLLAFDKWAVLALFVLIWVNDTAAYCVGSLTAKREGGNHKMFPRVSPKKSWEGLIGGFVFAFAAALLLQHFCWFDKLIAGGDGLTNTANICLVLLFALLTCAFGTLGDLMESLMKRTLGVKDSGRFLPGHGGVLDRFDSVMLAAPVLFIYCWVCYLVLYLL